MTPSTSGLPSPAEFSSLQKCATCPRPRRRVMPPRHRVHRELSFAIDHRKVAGRRSSRCGGSDHSPTPPWFRSSTYGLSFGRISHAGRRSSRCGGSFGRISHSSVLSCGALNGSLTNSRGALNGGGGLCSETGGGV